MLDDGEEVGGCCFFEDLSWEMGTVRLEEEDGGLVELWRRLLLVWVCRDGLRGAVVVVLAGGVGE